MPHRPHAHVRVRRDCPLTSSWWKRRFFAPWCGHCKKMKPDWDKLEGEFKDSAKVVIGNADCTAGGKSLCDKMGVRGYPTLK